MSGVIIELILVAFLFSINIFLSRGKPSALVILLLVALLSFDLLYPVILDVLIASLLS